MTTDILGLDLRLQQCGTAAIVEVCSCRGFLWWYTMNFGKFLNKISDEYNPKRKQVKSKEIQVAQLNSIKHVQVTADNLLYTF